MKDKKIVVLVGGPSSEAEVSRRTGDAVHKALSGAGYNVSLVELNRESLIDDLRKEGTEIVFNAVHGKFGEDGALQGLLEIANIPYTGSGIMASAIGMNKQISKKLFQEANIRTSMSKNYDLKKEAKDLIVKDIEEVFSYPLVIKAASQGGSSIGVSIVNDKNELLSGIDEISTIDHALLVESFLDGDEYTVAILDGKAMPVIKICPHSGSYNYASKYTVGATDYLVPAPISKELTNSIQELGEKSYAALECSGVARVDIMTNKEGLPHVLEVNTIPGMTETSLVPKAAKAMGYSFLELCEMILKTASVNKW